MVPEAAAATTHLVPVPPVEQVAAAANGIPHTALVAVVAARLEREPLAAPAAYTAVAVAVAEARQARRASS
jgi:hypothetical protein